MNKILASLLLAVTGQVAAMPTVAFLYSLNVPTKAICQYDIAVLDPYSDFKPSMCKKTLPVAYVSVGEIKRGIDYEKDINPKWVIGHNIAWHNNKIMDLTQPGWQNFVIDQLIQPLWKEGYRGFFLDTLDSYFLVTNNTDTLFQLKQEYALVDLIKKIKHRYPDAKIILNRGFPIIERVASDIYAVVIESLYHGWYQAKGGYTKTPADDQHILFQEIKKIQRLNIPIIVIDYLPPSEEDKAPALASKLKKQGFMPWITGNGLLQMYKQ